MKGKAMEFLMSSYRERFYDPTQWRILILYFAFINVISCFMKRMRRYRHQRWSVPYLRQRMWQVLAYDFAFNCSSFCFNVQDEHKFGNTSLSQVTVCKNYDPKIGSLELKYREVNVCSCGVTRIQDNAETTADKSFEFKACTKDSNKYWEKPPQWYSLGFGLSWISLAWILLSLLGNRSPNKWQRPTYRHEGIALIKVTQFRRSVGTIRLWLHNVGEQRMPWISTSGH
jgi:hypothetical protein